MFNEESRSKIPCQSTRCHVCKLPASGCACTDGGKHLLWVKSGLFRIDERFGICCSCTCHCNLVGCLGVLSASGRSHQDDVFAHAGKQRHCILKILLVAADHDRQRCIARSAVTAGYRCVHNTDTALFAHFVQFLGKAWRRSGHINGERTLLCAVKDAAFTAKDLLYIRRIADHNEDGICILNRLRNRLAGMDAELFLKLQKLFIFVGISADRITVLCKVSCLLAAHNTGSDPGNLVKFHKAFPFPVKTKSSFYLFV